MCPINASTYVRLRVLVQLLSWHSPIAMTFRGGREGCPWSSIILGGVGVARLTRNVRMKRESRKNYNRLLPRWVVAARRRCFGKDETLCIEDDEARFAAPFGRGSDGGCWLPAQLGHTARKLKIWLWPVPPFVLFSWAEVKLMATVSLYPRVTRHGDNEHRFEAGLRERHKMNKDT